jgi:hypothetical protein
MKGNCLCGAVRLESADAKTIGVCHCGTCRRWGGGPMFAVHCGSQVRFEGTDHNSEYASSEWARRAFCKTCGAHLYYKLLASGEYFVPAALFDTDDFVIETQIYIDRKPSYYDLANKTKLLTELQVVAQFSAAE